MGRRFAYALCTTMAVTVGSAMAEDITVRSGQPTAVTGFNFFDRDTCYPIQPPKPVVSTPPSHGKITIKPFKIKIENKESQCFGRMASVIGVIYQSTPGYRGPDHFVVEAEQIDPAYRGGMGTRDISLTVK